MSKEHSASASDQRVRRVYRKGDGDLTLDDVRAFVKDCAALDGKSKIRVRDVWGGKNGLGGDPFFCKAIETEQRDPYEAPR